MSIVFLSRNEDSEMTEYERQAVRFLNDSNTVMSIKHVGIVNGFPNYDRDNLPRNEYSVRLERRGNVYSFKFYDSAYNFRHDINPSAYDILSCVEKYKISDTIEDFASEFGYEISDSSENDRVSNIWRACREQYAGLMRLFGEEWMEKLREIN